MFDRPYKKQKKHTPLSEEALKRFDKEIPQRRNEWYARRAHHEDGEAETTDEQEEKDEPVAEKPEKAAGEAGVRPTSLLSDPAVEKKSPRLHPKETTTRLQFSNDDDSDEIAPGPSSPKMAELRARALEEAKAKHETAAERRKAADFRVAHREAVKAKREDGISKWAGKRGNVRNRRLPIVGILEVLGVIAIVVIGIVLVSKYTGRNQSKVSQTELKEASAFATLPTLSVDEVIEKFYQCTTVEDMLAYVRHPEVLEPVMRAWYAKNPIRPTAIEIQNTVEGMVSDGIINAPDQLWVTAAAVQLVDRSSTASVLVERTENEGFKIDWESTVGISESELKTFLSDRPATAQEFRIKVSPDDYYNYQFADNKKWVCFRVSSETDAYSCFGYVARGSAVAEELKSWFYPGETSIPIIATLRFPADPGENVEIVDAIQKNWIKHYASEE